MKVYVLTDDQYEQTVAGVFASAEAAMAERPDLTWEQASDEDFPHGFWWGRKELIDSRVFGFELKFAEPQTHRLPFDLAKPNGPTIEIKMAPPPLTIPAADTVLEALEELREASCGLDREQAYLLARLKEAGPGEAERAEALLRAVADTCFEPWSS